MYTNSTAPHYYNTYYHLYGRYLQLYTEKKKTICRVQSVPVVLYWQFALMLFCWLNMFCAFTLVISEVRVQFPTWLFSVVPWFRAFPLCCPGIAWTILRRFVAPVIPGITIALTFHLHCTSVGRYYYYYYSIITRSNFLFPMAQQLLVAQAFSWSRLHENWHNTLGRIPLDEWSVRRTDLYLTHTTLTSDRYPCPGTNRTCNPSKRATAEPRLRPRSHWDGHS